MVITQGVKQESSAPSVRTSQQLGGVELVVDVLGGDFERFRRVLLDVVTLVVVLQVLSKLENNIYFSNFLFTGIELNIK